MWWFPKIGAPFLEPVRGFYSTYWGKNSRKPPIRVSSLDGQRCVGFRVERLWVGCIRAC